MFNIPINIIYLFITFPSKKHDVLEKKMVNYYETRQF